MYPQCNHSISKRLSDEFQPKLDQLQGYKLTSPKEQMMKAALRQFKFKNKEDVTLPSMMWRRNHE